MSSNATILKCISKVCDQCPRALVVRQLQANVSNVSVSVFAFGKNLQYCGVGKYIRKEVLLTRLAQKAITIAKEVFVINGNLLSP